MSITIAPLPGYRTPGSPQVEVDVSPADIARKVPFGAGVWPSPRALSRWFVGDVDQAIRVMLLTHSFACAQTGTGQWQDCDGG